MLLHIKSVDKIAKNCGRVLVQGMVAQKLIPITPQ
jgi:hypothetical protein